MLFTRYERTGEEKYRKAAELLRAQLGKQPRTHEGNFWLRSLGWFAVALADLLDVLPKGEDWNSLRDIFTELMASVDRYADPETGLYWQVPDQGAREGNYLETSGSAMMAYAMLKGARLGVLGKEYAAKGQKTFDGIMGKYLTFSSGGLNLGGTCLVAGRGPPPPRGNSGATPRTAS